MLCCATVLSFLCFKKKIKSLEILTGFSILVRMFRRSIQCYTYGGECRLVQYMQVNVAMARSSKDRVDLYVITIRTKDIQN